MFGWISMQINKTLLQKPEQCELAVFKYANNFCFRQTLHTMYFIGKQNGGDWGREHGYTGGEGVSECHIKWKREQAINFCQTLSILCELAVSLVCLYI